jgi:biopolymer transport protein TolQ
MGILRLILDAGPVVKTVLAFLLLFSVASWAIIFLKMFQIRKAFTQSQIFLKAFWQAGNLDEIERTAEHLNSSPVASIFQAGTAEMNRVRKVRNVEGNGGVALPLSLPGIENVKRALYQSTSSELARLEAAVPFLATTGNSAPFIGLFGTVWGIMDSFRSIGEVAGHLRSAHRHRCRPVRRYPRGHFLQPLHQPHPVPGSGDGEFLLRVPEHS